MAVIGATGFVGRHLCDTCIGRGDQVSALVRRPDTAQWLAERGVTIVHGDLSDDGALERVCAGADVVFNASGALGSRWTDTQELELVNAWAPGRVVRCAAKSGCERVVHTSTAGVSGPLPPDVSASEEYRTCPVTDYQRTKLYGEQSVIKAHRETGIPVVIVRPAFIYGPGDMHKLSLFRAIKSRRMVLVNRGGTRLHPVHVDDVVYGLICAAERAPAIGEAYILAGPRPVTTRELVETIAAALGVPPPKLYLPESVLMPLARISEVAFGLLSREPLLTCSRVRLLCENYAYSIHKANKELRYKPVVRLPEGIAQTVAWYQDRHLFEVSKVRRDHARRQR